MLLSRSMTRKFFVTCGAIVGFTLLYQARTFDSRHAAEQAERLEETATPAPGLKLRFSATAYCKGETTASGATVRTGIAAADPALLPVGSVVRIESIGERYDGIYTVMDTGPSVRGREVDIYMWSCHEALAFGHRRATLTVLRLGWNPRASTPGIVDTLFKRREREAAKQPSAPPAALPPAGSGTPPASSGTPPAATEKPGSPR